MDNNENAITGPELWEFECLSCGTVTFVTSGANSSPEWADAAELGPSEWMSYPQGCMVCANGNPDPFIWRSYEGPVVLKPKFASTAIGFHGSSRTVVVPTESDD